MSPGCSIVGGTTRGHFIALDCLGTRYARDASFLSESLYQESHNDVLPGEIYSRCRKVLSSSLAYSKSFSK